MKHQISNKKSLVGLAFAFAFLGVAFAGGGNVTIPGDFGLHGAAGDPPSDVLLSNGGVLKRVDALIPEFTYVAPTGGTDVGGALVADQTFAAGVYHYDSLAMTGGTLTFSGGGDVHLHIRNGVTLDTTQISLQNGTTLILYSDTTVNFNSVTYLGNGQVQVQAAGDIQVQTDSFRGAALANNTLTLSGNNLSSIVVDDSLQTSSLGGASRSLKIMPIIEK
ncbi:MAG: hypothetical protein JKY65_28820 [Planctomycetes bacterium]|nr:hypothetical protein [Planctomycetota bacterium]